MTPESNGTRRWEAWARMVGTPDPAGNRNWTDVTEADCDVLEMQLGRRPQGVLKVAQRCRFGRPQVVVNAPVRVDDGGRARPFPTLFWLTCPYLVKAVGRLEAAGWIDRMRREFLAQDENARALELAHRAHARLRMALTDPDFLELLSPAEREVLESSGIGGMRRPSGVKCLHAHLADYLGRGACEGVRGGAAGDVSERAGGAETLGRTYVRGREGVNVVGRRTAGLLLAQGVDLKGSRACAACSGCRLGLERPIAALDVGSNAVRGLIARVDSAASRLVVVERFRRPTRLGAALAPAQAASASFRLPDESMRATFEAIAAFVARAKAAGAEAIAAVATAAVRESQGAEEFLLDVWERLGVSMPAIPGSEEARLAFSGALRALDPDAAAAPSEGIGPVTVIDIGGGSTEVVVGERSGAVGWRVSVPVGAVRLSREFGGSPAGAVYDAAKERLAASGVPPANEEVGAVVAVGGTAAAVASMLLELAAYDPDRIRGVRIRAEEADLLAERLDAIPPEERAQLPGLDHERAGIIVAGLAILRATMNLLGADELTVSDGGVLHGLLWEIAGI